VAYYDGSMEIFTIADGSSMGVFNGNSSGIASLAFSPDGGSIASAGWDNTIQTWNVSSGQVDQVLYQSQNSSPISTFRKVAFSPDGKLAAVSNYGEAISLIDALSGQKVSTTGNASGDYGAMAFDPEGKRLAAVSNNTNVDILDLASGNTLAQIPTIHNKPIQKLKFSPDGNTLATLSTEQLYLWNVQTGKKAWDLAGFNAFDYSPDGKILVSDSSDYGLYVWNTATGRQIAAPAAEYIEGLHYSPDGSRIAVVGWQVQSREKEHINLVYFVDAAEPKKRLPVKMTGLFREPREVEFSPDGTMLATSDSYGNIYIFDVIKGTQLALFEETGTLVYTLFFTPDQTTLIAASGDGALLYFQVRE
jgi:WD40 repeat protein